ncbi:hypothetical protein [uncultured Eudoraea sp.]|uniref:hypothetical protein n=1 Tax=uncultured Eudoraea sp. TaxID=1035614 RepID=UPI002621FED4|nr:hypothetical protein [uncultured Eudoraea sp.]
MNKVPFMIIFMGMCAFGANDLLAQQGPQKEAELGVEEEEGPMLFKFEPDYLAAEEARRKEILMTRAMIDSLDISEGKRQKLIRDLYKNNGSKKLNKILLANNKFEE